MRLISAVLASAFALVPNGGEAQLLPAGTFAARDGRPGPGKSWRIDDAQGARLAADINAIASKTPIVIDYEHQTLRAEANGQPAPAAGWITRVEWRAGQGLFASVNWTDAAKARIAGGEYRYISPVITSDEEGNVVGLHLAALVNHPALVGMEPVVAQLAARFNLNNEPESSMTLLAALTAALALKADAKDDDVVTAVTALKAKAAKADDKPALPAPLVTALGLKEGADEAAALAAITTLKGGDKEAMTAMAALQTQVATLSAQIATEKVTKIVEDAIAAHKLVPAQRDWAMKLGKADVAQLQAFVKDAPVLEGLKGQSNGDPGAGNEGSNDDAADLARRASLYQAEQLKAGITVNAAQAVAAVTAAAKK
jgi:phage I-like protein